MTYSPYRVLISTVCLGATILTVSPLMASAATKKTVKLAVSTASRCLTADMKMLNIKAVRQMDADIEKRGNDHESAVKVYQENIATIWSAMGEPYCGFGSPGLSAVRHSFVKSVNHVRGQFLVATK